MAGQVRDYFETNPYAQNVGQAVQGVTGLVGMYMNISDTVQDAKDFNLNAPTLLPSNPYERPAYNLGQAVSEAANFDPNEQGKGMIGQSALAGAGAGAAIGSMAGPWGTAIGAGAGALVGTISGAFGKDKVQSEARIAKNKEVAGLKRQQKGYNESLTSYDSNMDARDRYNKRLENRKRNIQRTIG